MYSAEVKYLASCLLLSSALREWDKRTSLNHTTTNKNTANKNEEHCLGATQIDNPINSEKIESEDAPKVENNFCFEFESDSDDISEFVVNPFRGFCLNLLSSCLSNAAICRSHRDIGRCTNVLKIERTLVDMVEVRTDNNEEDSDLGLLLPKPLQTLFSCKENEMNDKNGSGVNNSVVTNKLKTVQSTEKTNDWIQANKILQNNPKNNEKNNQLHFQMNLRCDILVKMSSVELIDACFFVSENIRLRSRKISILEKLHK